MDTDEYLKYGKEMVDYIAHYLNTVGERRVFPDVLPGYMRDLVASEMPEEGESWQTILADVERVVMPGMTHWQSPHMHAYFPATHSYPALLGDMLSNAINALGFTWASSPAVTELEVIVMDWLAKAIGLPQQFMHSKRGSQSGGGVIQTTCSEATFVALLAARTEAIKRLRKKTELNNSNDAVLVSQLVAYCSEQAHSSVEKAGLISLVKLRLLPTDDEHRLRADALQAAIIEDKKNGLTPFFLCATLGTTGCCSFDCLEELGPICEQERIWLHVDAAYAGSAFVCPEYRYLLQGIEYAQSFVFNPSKWLLVNFDCTAMWVTNSGSLHCTFNVDPLYLQHENSGDAIDYMHWQIPLSRRFRALKLWFVMRSYGLEGLQSHIRKNVGLGKFFEKLVRKDERFEIPAKRYLGLVVLRLKGHNRGTEQLLKNINRQGRIHMVPASLKGIYVIRFTVTSTKTTEQDLLNDWRLIQEETDRLLDDFPADPTVSKVGPAVACARPEMKRRSTWSHHNREWDVSLLLSNVPVHPNVVNGTFAALYNSMDSNDNIHSSADTGLVASYSRRKMNTRRVKSLDAGLMYEEPHTLNHEASFRTTISELSSDSGSEDSSERTDGVNAESTSPSGSRCNPVDLLNVDNNGWLPGSANKLLEKFANMKMFHHKLRLAADTTDGCGVIPSHVPVQEKDERNGHYGVDG